MTVRLRPEPRPIITLTTDFGQQDGYVGAMQGVILNICPAATIVNISHDIPPQQVRTAAFVLYQAFSYYPAHTVHCVVVDPGVGSKRRAVAVRTSHARLVGPATGVFSLALAARGVNVLEAVTLTNPDYQLASISATFHGRDIFAPAAAHIAGGTPLSKFGPSAINLVRFDEGDAASQSSETSRIIHIDHFGNLILDLTGRDLDDPEQVTIIIGDREIRSLSYTFADVQEGELLAYTGSTRGHIEIAVRNGNAARQLGLEVGDTVVVKRG